MLTLLIQSMYHKFLTPINSLKTITSYVKREVTKQNPCPQLYKGLLSQEETILILE